MRHSDFKLILYVSKATFNASLMSRAHPGSFMRSVLEYWNWTLAVTDDVELGHETAEELLLRNGLCPAVFNQL